MSEKLPYIGGEKVISVRTTKVLGALLGAMTIGALLLMVMESDPPRPNRGDLASARHKTLTQQWAITHPHPCRWRRIVVHSSAGGPDTLPRRCHFVVDAAADSKGQWIRPTELWKQQSAGYHVYVPGHDFNADSIGICIMGDFSTRSPDPDQLETLITLVCELQKQCRIGADSVYLQSELNPQKQLPGKAFPVGLFNARLYRPAN